MELQAAETVKGDEFMNLPLIIRRNIHRVENILALIFDDIKTQLKELTSHEMLVTIFPNMSTFLC